MFGNKNNPWILETYQKGKEGLDKKLRKLLESRARRKELKIKQKGEN